MSNVTDWSDAFYANVDGNQIDAVVEAFTPDGEMTFSGNPPAIGPVAIRELLLGFGAGLSGMRHEWINRSTADDGTAVLEADVHYTTRGGAEVIVPCVTLVNREASGLIKSLRVFLNPTPLFAALGAESGAAQEAVA